ncbi:MAG: glycosyltransferase, partial [Actinobacteria bacterium]|nr:glycosyltransferase [Actinomycetota bacterium]
MAETLTLVVPVYNEADYVPVALPRLVAAVEETAAPYRILIVENGSSDGTAAVTRELAEGLAVEVISLEEADYGAAMRAGFLAAEGEWVVNLDIDYFSADFLKRVLDQPATVDLVIGSKRDPSSRDRRPLLRRVATRVFNLLLRFILDSSVTDTHGMKGFRRALVEDLAPRVVSTRDLFDTELVVRAERAGYRIVEVPVQVVEMRSARSSLLKRVPRTILGL